MRFMNLKEIRLARGMTQEELAKKTGVSQSQIARYENGDCEPTLDTLRKLSKELNCTLDELIGNEVKDGDGHKGCAEAAAEDGEC